MLKQKAKILGTHPKTLEEMTELMMEKEEETKKYLAAEEKNNSYLTQIVFLMGKFQSLTSTPIPSEAERFAVETEA